MFKKFDEKEDIIGTQQLKSSAQKSIRSKIVEQLPLLDDYINDILPKKDSFKLIKCKEHVELIADCDGKILFIKPRDVPYFPTLRLLHQYPFILPHEKVDDLSTSEILKVDKGAIKFVLNGSQIMCRGLTSPGARLNVDVPENSV
ncbi:unnamed protein product, partial [Wuchereria bancrofti]